MLGLPYAREEWDTGLDTAVAICPECGERVALYVLKDFESFSKVEYRNHWVGYHEERK